MGCGAGTHSARLSKTYDAATTPRRRDRCRLEARSSNDVPLLRETATTPLPLADMCPPPTAKLTNKQAWYI